MTVNFKGSGSTFTQSGGTLSNTNIYWAVNTGASLTLINPLTIPAARSLAIDGTLVTYASVTSNGTTTVNGTFQLNAGGWATGNNFTYGAAGTLNFNNTSSYGVNSSDVFWPTSNSPVNVNVLQGGLTLNAARTVSGVFQTAAGVTNANNLTLNGTAQLNGGGYFNSTPTYGAASTLVYNTSSYGTSTNEFPASGVNNVSITAPSGTNTVTLDGDKTISGTLSIGAHVLNGGKSITASAITIGAGSMTMGNITTGSAFTCTGASSISLTGAWSVNGFAKSTSTVTFTGSGDINTATGFYNLTNTTGTRSIKADIDVENVLNVNGGQFGVTGGTGKSMTMSGAASVINLAGGAIYGTDAGAGNDLGLVVSGTQATLTGNATGSLDDEKKFFNVTVNSGKKLVLQRGILCKYGTFACNGTIQIDANGYVQNSGTYGANAKAPVYNASTGALVYNNGGAYTTAAEWPAANSPFNVSLQAAGTDVTLSGNRTIGGSLNLDNASGLKLTIPANLQLTVSGTLTNSAGANGLVVKSGGTLIQSSSAVDATVERDINAWGDVNHGWHFLSSPVAAQTIASGFTTATATEYDFYAWWEPTNQWVNYKNTTTAPVWATANVLGATSGAGDFIPGKGYLVEYLAADTKQFQGTLNHADIPVTNLVNSGTNRGWHLLGNPFTADIAWGTAAWSLTNINATAKVWKESIASYIDIAAGGPVTTIPAMNGFMVQVTAGSGGNNSLVIPASARVPDATTWYKAGSSSYIVLVANDPAGQTAQESVIRFDNAATTGFDPAFDAHFLAGYGPLFYALAGSEQLSTNVLPAVGGTVQIPFSFIKNNGSNFTIEASKIAGIGGPVILNDLKTNASQDLTVNPVYAFTSATGDDPNRFMVTFSHLGIGETPSGNAFTFRASGNHLLVSGNGTLTDASVFVYTMMGQLVVQRKLSGGSLADITLNGNTGYYLVKVVTAGNTYTGKVFINQ